MSRTPSYEYELLHQFEAIFRDGEHKTQAATRDYQRRWVIAMLERRAEFARMEAEAWRARVVILGLERGQISQQIAESDAAIRFAHEEFRLAPVTIRFRRYYEAQIAPEAPVIWDELPAVRRLFPGADGRDR